MNELIAWLLSIGSFAAIVLLTALAAKSIAGDPAHGRRRCPRCWHEIGPTGLRCAECGHEAATDADLSRTRRRLWRGAVAIVLILAIGTAARVRFLDSGPWSVAPTGVLLWATPALPYSGYRSAPWELAHRVQTGIAEEAQVREALGLAIEGDSSARPATAAWERKYEPLLRAALRRLQRDDPALLGLLGIPPVLRAQPIVGDGSEPLVAIELDEWWPGFIECEATVTLPDGSKALAGFRPDGRAQSLLVPLGSSDEGDITVDIAQRIVGSDAPFKPHASLRARLPRIDREDGRILAESLAPVDSEGVRAAVASVFEEGLVVWRSGSPRAGMRFGIGATGGEELERTVFGLVVEVLEDGVPRRTTRLWWRGGSGATKSWWLPSVEDLAALDRLFATGGEDAGSARNESLAGATAREPVVAPVSDLAKGWTMRIRGDRQIAALAASRPKDASTPAPDAFFAGTIEMPLRVTRIGSASPARRWMPLDASAAGNAR